MTSWTALRDSFWLRLVLGLVLTLGFALAVGLTLGGGTEYP
jgi:hypothetical protein